MEYLDIYDENACKTGKTIIRGTPVRQGEYSMAVHLYIYNAKGEFLIQKRSKNKKSLPGIWSVTCGAVVAGENSLQAGIREAQECVTAAAGNCWRLSVPPNGSTAVIRRRWSGR